MCHTALHTLMDEIRTDGWEGFSTRYWVVGDLDLQRQLPEPAPSFLPGVTRRQVLDELLTPVLGEGTAERTWKAFDLVEQATNLIDENDMGFSFPVPERYGDEALCRQRLPGSGVVGKSDRTVSVGHR